MKNTCPQKWNQFRNNEKPKHPYQIASILAHLFSIKSSKSNSPKNQHLPPIETRGEETQSPHLDLLKNNLIRYTNSSSSTPTSVSTCKNLKTRRSSYSNLIRWKLSKLRSPKRELWELRPLLLSQSQRSRIDQDQVL